MKKYSYDMLVEDLIMGREVEFEYKENLCIFINDEKGRVFVCDNEIKSNYYKNVIKLLENVKLDDITIKEIFENTLYNADTLYIL
ncbi:hypothetical protein [Wukongibacter sp. M2B1]|uniref:hypothetical protein n=1 Tax=Wukongibacter sp. M2B1 TaxID=3088895 RepID=UPI003D7978ED